MTEEELIKDLQRRGRTPGTIQSIVQGNSVLAVQKAAIKKFGVEMSQEEAEQVAQLWRKDFLESIDVIEAGGAMFDPRTDSYMTHKTFNKE